MTDWVPSVAATVISLVALALSMRNRRNDIAREEAFQLRQRVWTILDREPGLRTVLALDEPDGQTPSRIRYLRRTVEQIEVAGAARLASELSVVLDQTWGTETAKESLSTRREFLDSARRFLKPPEKARRERVWLGMRAPT
jgi:hypothetical protein